MLPSGKLLQDWEEDRAGLYGYLPIKHQQGLTKEQIQDMKDLAPEMSDDEQKSKARMIKIAYQNDLRQLYYPHLTQNNRFAIETDFQHFEALGDPQRQPDQRELSQPPSYTFAETLNRAIKNGQAARNEFIGTAGRGRR